VDYVYLRKQGDNTTDGDDGYALRQVTASLFYFGVVPARVDYEFVARGEKPWLWLANENGHVVYLTRGRIPGES
jgi:hypothetical protein